MMSFEDKTVVVTGGARGIGREIVKRFTGSGAKVYIFDKQVDDDSKRELPDSAICIEGDITDVKSVESLFGQIIESTGRVDVLVNNAGIIRDNVIWRMPEEDFDAVLNTNLKGCWLMCKQAAPIMRSQQSGRIVNIASRAWLGNPGQSNYSAAKGGLVSLTRVLALELARSNVTVNAVAPGLIDTPMTQALPPEVLEKLINLQPSKKSGQPSDIASAVAFLASDEAGFITGQLLHVDGGRSIGSTVF